MSLGGMDEQSGHRLAGEQALMQTKVSYKQYKASLPTKGVYSSVEDKTVKVQSSLC